VHNEKNPDGHSQRDEKNPRKRSFHAVYTPLRISQPDSGRRGTGLTAR